MSSSDKNTIIGILGCLLVLGFAVLCIFGTQSLPIKWIVLIAGFIEICIIAPLICKKVFEISQIKGPWFLPIYSIVITFQKPYIISTLALTVISILDYIIMKLQINPFGLTDFGLNFPRYSGIALYFFVVFLSISIGLGYFDLLRQCNNLLRRYQRNIKTFWMYILFLCVPFIRVVGMVQIFNLVSTLKIVTEKYGSNIDEDSDNFEIS